MDTVLRYCAHHMMTAAVAASFLLMPIMVVLGKANRKKRAEFLARFFEKRGYRLLNPNFVRIDGSAENLRILTVEANDGIKGLYPVGLTMDINPDYEAFCLDYKEMTLTIFQCSRTKEPTQIVAKLKKAGFPSFRLEKKSLSTTILDTAGVTKNITFDNHPEFPKHYHLIGTDQAGIKSLFTNDKLATLLQKPLSGSLTSNAEYLVYYEPGYFKDESSYDAFIARAQEAMAIFL